MYQEDSVLATSATTHTTRKKTKSNEMQIDSEYPVTPDTKGKKLRQEHAEYSFLEEWRTPEQNVEDLTTKVDTAEVYRTFEQLQITPKKLRKKRLSEKFDRLLFSMHNSSTGSSMVWNDVDRIPMERICTFLTPKDICCTMMRCSKTWYWRIAREEVWKEVYSLLNSHIRISHRSFSRSWRQLVLDEDLRDISKLVELRPTNTAMNFEPAFGFTGDFDPSSANYCFGFINSQVKFCLEILPRFFWVELCHSSHNNGDIRFGVATFEDGNIFIEKGLESFQKYWISITRSGELLDWGPVNLRSVVLALITFEALPILMPVSTLCGHSLSFIDCHSFCLQLGLSLTDERIFYLHGRPPSGHNSVASLRRFTALELLGQFHDENLDMNAFAIAVLTFDGFQPMRWHFEKLPLVKKTLDRRPALTVLNE